ncbi:bifunctional DNA primase/polymerase-like protein [Herbihabitans rhizosphaerae]|uniref:Bifunctional DNA primase/polymerase-like protein n=2 Tax=Herbihabitans rhizosphaerae TaxID=1872711 RepID=A0A4Q7KNB4_9PSEU|nr:bifunctional DNA primase/polymerase-like protein [Herbihabitans rhizosphaerae]
MVAEHESTEAEDGKASGVERAAQEYAAHGWLVLPGSTWNGRSQYVVPGQSKITNGLRPLEPRNYATCDSRVIAKWFRPASVLPSVLLRTSVDTFVAVSVEHTLADKAIQTSVFQASPGPVAFRPDTGRAYFCTAPAGVLDAMPGSQVDQMKPGDWIPAPPTHVQGSSVYWWIPPWSVDWSPVNVDVLGKALRLAATHRAESAGTA